jgi:oligopeptide/dipeptide ABC transporter ATP-binding protein
MVMEGDSLLVIDDLKTYFFTDRGVVKAVDGLSLKIGRGESLGIVGESGSGKSVTFFSVLKLIQHPGRIVGGRILFQGEDLVKKRESEMMHLRGAKISMIFQDPLTALNPVLRIGEQISETILFHERREFLKKAPSSDRVPTWRDPWGRKALKEQARDRALEMLELVKIPSAVQRLEEYPHQFSGGMRQRVVIAIALSCNPSVLVADEPTTALDVTIQAQILELLTDIRQKLKMSLILITHNFGVAKELCDRIAVMYAGKIVELSGATSLFEQPKHPYTKALMECIPEASKKKVRPIPGLIPSLIDLPSGCSFHPRCQHTMEQCKRESPSLKATGGGGFVRCHLYGS